MDANEKPHKAAYPEPLDAIVLAGTDSNPRRMIQGQNKAFLEIAGRPLVREVVEALLAAESVGDVYIDFLAHVWARDPEHLRDLAMTAFTTREEVSHIETELIFEHIASDELPPFLVPGAV